MSEILSLSRTVLNSSLSYRARHLYVDFANLAVDNYFFPSQAAFAKELGCSKTTVGRAIKELVQAGFLVDTGDRDVKRRKKYGLISPLIGNLSLNPSPPSGEGLEENLNITTEEEFFETLTEEDQIVYITGKYVPLWEEAKPEIYHSIVACFNLREAIKHILRGSTRHRREQKKDVKTWVLERLKILEPTFKPATSIKPVSYAVWG